MTRQELHNELSKVLYIEDYNIIDTLVATTVANLLRIGDPVWLTIVGASSAGKSQLIRPFAKSNPTKFLQVDDLTPNTLISGNGESQSMMFRLGKDPDGKRTGIITIDDMTVIFSKESEARNAILGQLRMIYDGRMTKGTGKGQMIEWVGHAGIIAGSTPTIYRKFGEVADMGERFLMYRMKDMDVEKAMHFIDNHERSARDIDEHLRGVLDRYFTELLPQVKDKQLEVDQSTKDKIREISIAATTLRTPVTIDDREHFVSEFVVPEMPFRVSKQLTNIAHAFMLVHNADTEEETLPEELQNAVEWCGYSIADDKRRSFFRAIISLEAKGLHTTLRNISAHTGLHQTAVERGLSILTAIGIVSLSSVEQGGTERKTWSIIDQKLRKIVKRIDPPSEVSEMLLDDDL